MRARARTKGAARQRYVGFLQRSLSCLSRTAVWRVGPLRHGPVSGHAAGVDEAAHAGALEAGGTTTAVLAEGLARAKLRPVLRAAPDAVLVVSGFAPDAKWTAFRAMERNETIAGLSEALVLMAADERGGSWEQAQLCLRAGKRPIVADFDGTTAPGNRRLIDSGRVAVLDPAKPRSVWSLLDEFSGPPEQTSLLG